MSSVTPQEAYKAMDAITKASLKKRQLMVDVYCTIKGIEYIPEIEFITNADQFSKIELLIGELINKGQDEATI